MRRMIIGTALILLSAVGGTGQQPRSQQAGRLCKGNAEVIGKCYRVHGRAFATNGTPNLRIWQIGTDRILGVTGSGAADDAEDAIAPDNLFRALNGYEHFVFGNFDVCPFTQENEGHMRMVCIERADNLVIEPHSYGSRK
jgi:hypothetical protein